MILQGSDGKMTYHMEQMNIRTRSKELGQKTGYIEHTMSSPKGQTLERRIAFPERLWEVVNDTYDLVNWGTHGDTIVAEADRFESEVRFWVLLIKVSI